MAIDDLVALFVGIFTTRLRCGRLDFAEMNRLGSHVGVRFAVTGSIEGPSRAGLLITAL